VSKDDSDSLFFPLTVAKTYRDLELASTINLIKEELKGLTGVYAFKHNETGKMYIGSAVNL